MPQGQTSTRIARLHEVMRLFKSHSHVGLGYDELYERGFYGADTKTFERDKQFLNQGYGVVIDYDHKTRRYYLVDEGSFLFNIDITDREAEALALALKMVEQLLPHMASPAQKMWQKLNPYIPLEAGRNADSLSEFVQIVDAIEEINANTFETLSEAITASRNVNIRYKESGQPARRLTVSPISIQLKGGVWYLEASTGAGSPSLYAINRITSAIIYEEATNS